MPLAPEARRKESKRSWPCPPKEEVHRRIIIRRPRPAPRHPLKYTPPETAGLFRGSQNLSGDFARSFGGIAARIFHAAKNPRRNRRISSFIYPLAFRGVSFGYCLAFWGAF